MSWGDAKKKSAVWSGLSHWLRRGLPHLICPNGCMTSTRSPLTLFCTHVAQFGSTAAGDLARKSFTESGMAADLAGDLTVVLRQGGRGVGQVRRARLVEFLVTRAPHDDAAALCAVVSLRPELEWIARLSTHRSVSREEAEADVVAAAWEVVTKAACRSTPLLHAAVVNAIWSGVRRSAGLRRVGLEIVPLTDDFDQAAPDVDRLERWPGLLAAAVARGVLTPRQVAVIAQTRMERRSLRQVAFELGRTYDSLRMERARGEAALRQFALEHFSSEES
jgi:hypothetical protein